MTINSSSDFDVADQEPLSIVATATIQPPAAVGAGRGRLTHPTLGVYDYANTPTETVGIDGDIVVAPLWSHAQTLSGGIDTEWLGFLRDGHVVERWIHGDTGGPIAHLRALWSFFANPPADPIDNPVIWAPSYANAHLYYVVLVAVRSGGEGYRLDRKLAQWGYAPSPVELELRIRGRAD